MDINIEDVLKGLAELETKATAAMMIYGQTAAMKLEKEAKEGASWTDRTGLSRKTIQGGSKMEGNKCVVYVAGNTEQFPYLELAHDKKYAILQPTVNKMSPEIMKGFNNLLGR